MTRLKVPVKPKERVTWSVRNLTRLQMANEKAFNVQSAYSDLNKACSAQAYDKIINISGKSEFLFSNTLLSLTTEMFALHSGFYYSRENCSASESPTFSP